MIARSNKYSNKYYLYQRDDLSASIQYSEKQYKDAVKSIRDLKPIYLKMVELSNNPKYGVYAVGYDSLNYSDQADIYFEDQLNKIYTHRYLDKIYGQLSIIICKSDTDIIYNKFLNILSKKFSKMIPERYKIENISQGDIGFFICKIKDPKTNETYLCLNSNSFIYKTTKKVEYKLK